MTSFVPFWVFFLQKYSMFMHRLFTLKPPLLHISHRWGNPNSFPAGLPRQPDAGEEPAGCFLWPRTRRRDGGGRGAAPGPLNPPNATLPASPHAPAPFHQNPRGVFLFRVLQGAGSALPGPSFPVSCHSLSPGERPKLLHSQCCCGCRGGRKKRDELGKRASSKKISNKSVRGTVENLQRAVFLS